jgi:hypothetical protein
VNSPQTVTMRYPSNGWSVGRPAADSPADPAADPASNLRIGDPPAGVPAGHGGSCADAHVADSLALCR